MVHEFSRTELLIGARGIKTLAGRTAAVFGLGGVGSHCAEALARSGIGRLILTDSDTVSLTNINRQSIAYHSTVGRPKTQVMREKILDINPSASVTVFDTFVLPDNVEDLFQQAGCEIDYIVDAIDTVTGKIALIQYAFSHHIPIISAMGTGNKLRPELFQISDLSKTSVCPLCRVMRRELKKRGIQHLKVLYSTETPIHPDEKSEEVTSRRSLPGSISFVPPVAGLMIAGEVILDLLGIEKV